MSRSVPKIGRILDAASAAFFVFGALLYGYAWFGLRDQEAPPASSPGEAFSFAAVERVEDLHRLSDQGLGLMVVGAVLAIVAAVAAHRAGARRTDGSPE